MSYPDRAEGLVNMINPNAFIHTDNIFFISRGSCGLLFKIPAQRCFGFRNALAWCEQQCISSKWVTVLFNMLIHGQLENTVPHVTLASWFLTGRCNVNKNNVCLFTDFYYNISEEKEKNNHFVSINQNSPYWRLNNIKAKKSQPFIIHGLVKDKV